jgi:hypothetical protein
LIEKIAIAAFQLLRPGWKFHFDASQAFQLIELFDEYLNRYLDAPIARAAACITVASPGEPLSRRCGSSYKDDEDLDHLFLETVHSPLQSYQNSGDEISSFYVKRSRHIAFFGPLEGAEG